MVNKAELIGIDEVEKILNQLPAEIQKKVLQPALRQSAKPMLESAKQNLLSAPGGDRLIQALKIKALRRKGYRVGINAGAYPSVRSVKRSDAAWEAMGAYWTEFGTMEFMTIPRSPKTKSLATAQRKAGMLPSMKGRVQPVAWLRRAFDAHQGNATEEFRKVLWKGINSFLRRYAKKIKWSGTQ